MGSLVDRIKERVIKMEGVEHLDENPNSERFNYMSSEETAIKQHLDEYRVFYIGDSDELTNYYLNQVITGNAKNPIYNRNKKRYFWALSEKECSVKRIHTGIPRAAIQTTVNLVGDFFVKCDQYQPVIDKIVENNNLSVLVNQQGRPLTLAEGWGAYKPTFDRSVSDTPIIEYYEAQDVDFAYKNKKLVGIIYKDFYKYQNKNYVLLETRRIDEKGSYIEFELYRLEESNEVTPVNLYSLPELSGLPEEGYFFKGVKCILGVPSIYLHDILNKGYGLSVLAGKIDIADDMDMIATVESMTEQNSGPVEYYPVDLLKRTKNGKPEMPVVFGRTYVKKPTTPNADGVEDGKIDTSAPQLNFGQYREALIHKIEIFLAGWLSPATFGIDVSRKDNALAQREKEKVSIFFGKNMIAMERKQIQELIKVCLMLQEYMNTGAVSLADYDISVQYGELANPSYESLLNTLVPAYAQGGLSTQMYVNRLYGDTLSDEEKAKEVAWIEEQRNKDFDLGDFDNGEGIEPNIPETTDKETPTPNFEE